MGGGAHGHTSLRMFNGADLAPFHMAFKADRDGLPCDCLTQWGELRLPHCVH